MTFLKSVHHVAIICSQFDRSKKFYTEVLGFRVVAEHYRRNRDSYKLDLALDANYCLELFSFPDPPARTSRPEACGLRHIAFEVDDLAKCIAHLNEKGIDTEPIRVDEFTGKRFTFLEDPDKLPIELYER